MREMQSRRRRLLLVARRRLRARGRQVLRLAPDEVRAHLERRRICGRRSRTGGSTCGRTSSTKPGICVCQPLGVVAKAWNCRPTRAQALLDSARAKLFAARELRVQPGPRRENSHELERADDQRHGAGGARVRRCDVARVGAPARADFIRATLWRDGRLLATYKDGTAHLNAYLDDYAFLLDALLELMQHDFRAAISSGRARSRTCCSTSSRTASTADSFSSATITSSCSIAPRAAATTRRHPATASRRLR